MVSECYGGEARGWGSFDVQTPGDGTDFAFFVDGTNVDFNAMGRALWSPTNQLRGALSGTVTVTRANSSDWRTWNGFGQMQLRDGLLWDAPIFGLVSPVLNTLTPGLDVGSSRATDGAGRFTMTNGVIYTDSLDIRSLTMRRAICRHGGFAGERGGAGHGATAPQHAAGRLGVQHGAVAGEQGV